VEAMEVTMVVAVEATVVVEATTKRFVLERQFILEWFLVSSVVIIFCPATNSLS
jgi:hypothetical protein